MGATERLSSVLSSDSFFAKLNFLLLTVASVGTFICTDSLLSEVTFLEANFTRRMATWLHSRSHERSIYLCFAATSSLFETWDHHRLSYLLRAWFYFQYFYLLLMGPNNRTKQNKTILRWT